MDLGVGVEEIETGQHGHPIAEVRMPRQPRVKE